MSQKKLELLILAHRYLYYVLAQPVISDYEYDKLETEAKKILPLTSQVHEVGSDLAESYSDEVKIKAHKLLTGEQDV